MTLRVGIISANWGAFAHLPAWRAVPGVEVVGICTSRQETAEAAAKRFDIARPYWNAQTMVAEPDIDIIDCGTRPSIRYDMVLSALQHGKNVYNAIPFAANLEQARTLHAAWRESGKVAVVDAFSQWVPALRLAKEMIDGDFLGRPFGGSCFFNLSLFNQPHPQFPYNWFAEAGLGVSAMRNLGSHALHYLVHLFGEVDAVVADDTQLLGEWRFPDGSIVRPETNDFANMILRFVSGMTMQLQVSWSAPVGRGWNVDIFGSKGRITAGDPSFPTSPGTSLLAGRIGDRSVEPVAIPERLMRPAEITIGPDVHPSASHPMAISMHRMVEAIRGNGRAAPGFAQAWHVECILEAARVSAQARTWVNVADICK
ncbi:MAG TPA: Gfo/Idh/MocA family oxidoreductase [Acetobacteraceae bacterium]|nr:Gfo/Idh/MocA family oxidoreductase [Acetobacteraceae bacterium]